MVVVGIFGNLTDKRPPASTTHASTGNTRTTLPEAYTEVPATIIILKGELCAKVTNVESLQKDTYQVECSRYRDGSGTASYEVNARTGAVKQTRPLLVLTSADSPNIKSYYRHLF